MSVLLEKEIILKCGKTYTLKQLEDNKISYIPFGIFQKENKIGEKTEKPLFEYRHLWDSSEVKLETFGKAVPWNISKMYGVQIFTGRPTSRSGPLFLFDIDIERLLVSKYPELTTKLLDTYRKHCDREPCIIKTKSGGYRLSGFIDLPFPPGVTEGKCKDTNEMLIEFFCGKKLSKIDRRYEQLEGSLLDIPNIDKTLVSDFQELTNSIINYKSSSESKAIKTGLTSQIGELDIKWERQTYKNTTRFWSQLFPSQYCALNKHKSNRLEVRFIKRNNGSIYGICHNCNRERWEVKGPDKFRPQRINELMEMPEVSLNSMESNADIVRYVFTTEHKLIAVKADTGIGKTELAIESSKEKPTVFVTPTHKLAREISSRMSAYNIEHLHFKSRNYIVEDVNGNIVEEMCKKRDLCNQVSTKGYNINLLVCDTCEYKTECATSMYLSQHKKLEESKNIVVCYPNMPFKGRKYGQSQFINFKDTEDDKPKSRRVVVDELTEEGTCREFFFSIKDIHRCRDEFKDHVIHDFMVDLLHELDAEGNHPLEAIKKTLEEYEPFIKEIKSKRKYKRITAERKEKIIESDFGDIVSYHAIELPGGLVHIVNDEEDEYSFSAVEERINYLKQEKMAWAMGILTGVKGDTSRIEVDIRIDLLCKMEFITPENYEALLPFYSAGYPVRLDFQDDDEFDIFEAMQLFIEKYTCKENAPIVWTRDGLRFWIPPEVSDEIDQLVLMSATLDETITTHLFEEINFFHATNIEIPENRQLFQLATGHYSRQSLLIPELVNNKWKYDKITRSCKRFLDSFNKFSENKQTAIITFKVLADMLRENKIEHNFKQIYHYGEIEGLDADFQNLDNLIVLGCPEIPPEDLIMSAKKIFGTDETPIDTTRDIDWFQDERMKIVYYAKVKSQIKQAVGRARIIRPERKTNVICATGVYIEGLSQQATLIDIVDLENAEGDIRRLLDSSNEYDKEQEIKDKIKEKYKNGITQQVLADEYGRTVNQIRTIVKDVPRITNEQKVYEFISNNNG